MTRIALKRGLITPAERKMVKTLRALKEDPFEIDWSFEEYRLIGDLLGKNIISLDEYTDTLYVPLYL